MGAISLALGQALVKGKPAIFSYFFAPSLGQAGLEMLSHTLVHNTTSNSMKIAIPKEIKKQEYRVGLLPSVAYQLVQQGHTVLVERGAGVVTGYPDADYE